MMRKLVTAAVLVALSLSACHADVEYFLDNVPDYYWYKGCAPTSGGMLIGYWDNQPGYGDLYEGTAPMYAGSGTQTIDGIISSTEHNNSTYVPDECTHDNTPPPGDIGPNSIGCFMHTNPSNGSTTDRNIPSGLRRYALYDDPDTATDESYYFHSLMHYTNPSTSWPDPVNDALFTFEDYQKEIDAGRPMEVVLSLDGGGHAVVGYGYWIDDTGQQWYAVRDTWQDGNSNGTYGVTSTLHNGREYWLWKLRESGEYFGGAYYVDNAVFFIPDDDGPMQEDEDYSDYFDSAEPVNQTIETIYAEIDSGDVDYYQIWLDPGDRLATMVQNDKGYDQGMRALMVLYDPNGNEEVGFYGLSPRLWYRADEAGWWRLSVEGYGEGQTGNYALAMIRQPIPEPGTAGLLVVGLGLTALRLRRRGRRAGL